MATHKCADYLFLNGPMTAGDLAELTGLATGAITGVIDRLAQAGFVKRAEGPKDRRQVIPERIAEVAPLFETLPKTMAEVCSHFSDEQLSAILEFQTRTQQGLRAATRELRQQLLSGKRPGGAKGGS
jgi:DNA-binding MarR family transcriptional regulator